MIDTDRYEGHTEGPWKVIEKANDYQTTNVVVGKTIVASNVSPSDSALIADAPLLLEEVKRLQRELDTQYEYIEWLEEFAPKAGDYNTAWEAYELAKGIHWTQMEEEE